MTGIDRIKDGGTDGCKVGESVRGPAIVLIEPQLGENIGTAARAMLNFELSDLRLVRPRAGWQNEKAIAAASGAKGVLSEARLFECTEEAIADLTRAITLDPKAKPDARRVRDALLEGS